MFSPLSFIGFGEYVLVGFALGLGLALATGMVALLKLLIGAAQRPAA